jgi:hypothetical protein
MKGGLCMVFVKGGNGLLLLLLLLLPSLVAFHL